MTKQRRKFTESQKLEILRDAGDMGINAALRKYQLSYSAFSRWRGQLGLEYAGVDQILPANNSRSELKHYQEENALLKKIVAEQAIELLKKEEQLRKNNVSVN